MIPGNSTAGAQAIAAVYALARDNLTGVQVLDGPPGGGGSLDPATLVVGYGGQGGPAVLSNQQRVDMLGRAREEGDIVCILGAFSGDPGWPDLRELVADALDELVAALQRFPILDGCWLGETIQWNQNAEPDGYSVQCAFSVHYVAEL